MRSGLGETAANVPRELLVSLGTTRRAMVQSAGRITWSIGMRKTCRKYWNASIAERIVQLDGIRFDNPQFRIDTTFTADDFTSKLIDVFGVERASIDRFFAEVRATDFIDESTETVADFFERHFPGRNDVHRLLLELISYANDGRSWRRAKIVFGNSCRGCTLAAAPIDS
jgi:hypothetical protein